jgi:hypothetical protein
VKHGIQTSTATAGQWIQAIADDGTVTKTAPTKADVGLGNVDNTSDVTKNSATAILTNKQVTPRVVAMTPVSNTVTPNADTMDVGTALALTAPTTVAGPSASLPGNPADQQDLELVFKSVAPQTLTFVTTAYSTECGLALPTSTTGDGVTYNHFLFRYQAATTKWCLLATTKAPLNRVTTLTSSATFSCPWPTSDQCSMQMTGPAGTVTFADPPAGSQNDGDLMMYLLLCTNAQTLAFGNSYIASPNIPLPTACPANTTTWTVLGFRYSSLLAKNQLIGAN